MHGPALSASASRLPPLPCPSRLSLTARAARPASSTVMTNSLPPSSRSHSASPARSERALRRGRQRKPQPPSSRGCDCFANASVIFVSGIRRRTGGTRTDRMTTSRPVTETFIDPTASSATAAAGNPRNTYARSLKREARTRKARARTPPPISIQGAATRPLHSAGLPLLRRALPVIPCPSRSTRLPSCGTPHGLPLTAPGRAVPRYASPLGGAATSPAAPQRPRSRTDGPYRQVARRSFRRSLGGPGDQAQPRRISGRTHRRPGRPCRAGRRRPPAANPTSPSASRSAGRPSSRRRRASACPSRRPGRPAP